MLSIALALGAVVSFGPRAAADDGADSVEDVSAEESRSLSAVSAAVASTPSSGADASRRGDPGAARAAVVLVGVPSPEALAAATRVAEAVASVLALPEDAALRASLLGVEDSIETVARERRALGMSEASDVPRLVALGDLADAAILLVVRRRAGRRELVAFDVARAAFFEGELALASETSEDGIVRFARARARAAVRGLSGDEGPSSESEAASRVARGNDERQRAEEERRPDWLELNWPYLVAGALLAGAAAFVIVLTTQDDREQPPVLRFRPGGVP